MSRAANTLLILLLVLVEWVPTVAADDAETERNKRLTKMYQQAAAAYRFTVVGSDDPLRLHERPVMQWMNVARVGTPRVQHGSVFIWTRNGRAEVLATIFSQTKPSQDPTFYHEMHSLSTGLIEAERNGAVYWNPAQAGIERKPFPGAPKPAANERLRMVQMRALARQFSGHSINYDQARWNLELLPEPLYRMRESTSEMIDSAVFALLSTAGTDPEVLIVIEAPIKEEQSRWEYAVCRFSDLKTWVSLNDQEVWSFINGTQGPTADAGPSDRYRFSIEGSQRVPR